MRIAALPDVESKDHALALASAGDLQEPSLSVAMRKSIKFVNNS